MKSILVGVTFLTTSILSFGQEEKFEYGHIVALQGSIALITYQMPTDDNYETYILKLEKNINVKSNDEWQAHTEVDEIHLNIMNDLIEKYVGKKIIVKGFLFHSRTIHHRRDICIKVDQIKVLDR